MYISFAFAILFGWLHRRIACSFRSVLKRRFLAGLLLNLLNCRFTLFDIFYQFGHAHEIDHGCPLQLAVEICVLSIRLLILVCRVTDDDISGRIAIILITALAAAHHSAVFLTRY